MEEGYKVTLRSHLDQDLPEINLIAPDLIIIDYMWATTDDNWSMLQLLRLNTATRETPIVLCTGAIKEAISLNEHLREMNIDVVLKPFDIDRFLKVIAGAIERHSKQEESTDPVEQQAGLKMYMANGMVTSIPHDWCQMDASDMPLADKPPALSQHDRAVAIYELCNALTIIRAFGQLTQRRLDRLGALDPEIGTKAMSEITLATGRADAALRLLENCLEA